MDPIARQTAEELLDHPVFDDFRDWFQPELEVLYRIYKNKAILFSFIRCYWLGKQKKFTNQKLKFSKPLDLKVIWEVEQLLVVLHKFQMKAVLLYHNYQH